MLGAESVTRRDFCQAAVTCDPEQPQPPQAASTISDCYHLQATHHLHHAPASHVTHTPLARATSSCQGPPPLQFVHRIPAPHRAADRVSRPQAGWSRDPVQQQQQPALPLLHPILQAHARALSALYAAQHDHPAPEQQQAAPLQRPALIPRVPLELRVLGTEETLSCAQHGTALSMVGPCAVAHTHHSCPTLRHTSHASSSGLTAAQPTWLLPRSLPVAPSGCATHRLLSQGVQHSTCMSGQAVASLSRPQGSYHPPHSHTPACDVSGASELGAVGSFCSSTAAQIEILRKLQQLKQREQQLQLNQQQVLLKQLQLQLASQVRANEMEALQLRQQMAVLNSSAVNQQGHTPSATPAVAENGGFLSVPAASTSQTYSAKLETPEQLLSRLLQQPSWEQRQQGQRQTQQPCVQRAVAEQHTHNQPCVSMQAYSTTTGRSLAQLDSGSSASGSSSGVGNLMAGMHASLLADTSVLSSKQQALLDRILAGPTPGQFR